MRLFKDVHRPRERAELLLLFSDVATLSCAVIFASGVGSIGSSSFFDTLFVTIWCALPRCAGRSLVRLQTVRGLTSSFFAALASLVGLGLLALLGIELLWFTPPPEQLMLPITLISLLTTWGCAFFLSFPRSYRVWDLLVGSTLLLGTIEAYSNPLPWLIAALFFWLLSATTRHLIYNVFPTHSLFRDLPKRLPKTLNLRNAAMATFLLSAVAVVTLVSSYLLLVPWLGTPHATHRPTDGRAAQLPTPSMGSGPQEGLTGEDALPSDQLAAAEGGTAVVVEFNPPTDVALQSVAESANDRRPAFYLELLETQLQSPWRPTASTLFRSFVHDQFNPTSNSWSSTQEGVVSTWSNEGTYAPPTAKGTADQAQHTVAIQVPQLFTGTLFSPDRAIEFGPLLRVPPDEHFIDYGDGVIQPIPALAANTLYVVRFVEDPATLAQLPRAVSATPAQCYLQIPDSESLGIDVHNIARRVFADQETLSGQVEALARWMRQGFLYYRSPKTLDSKAMLASVCQQGIGNCIHLSTLSALLLRSRGIATRLVTGYVGAEWHEDKLLAVVHRYRAHAWLEVWGGDRWYALDPTDWVRMHPESESEPSDASEASEASTETTPFDDSVAEAGDNPETVTPHSAIDASPTEPRESDVALQPAAARTEAASFDQSRDSFLSASRRLREWQDARAQQQRQRDRTQAPERGSADSGLARQPQDNGELLTELITTAGHVPRPLLIQATVRLLLLLFGALAVLLVVRSILRPAAEDGSDKREGEESPELDTLTVVPLGANTVEEWTLTETDSRGQLLYTYHQLQQQLARVRLQRRPEETPHEHATRLCDVTTSCAEELNTLADCVTLALYDDTPVADPDVESARALARQISRALR